MKETLQQKLWELKDFLEIKISYIIYPEVR